MTDLDSIAITETGTRAKRRRFVNEINAYTTDPAWIRHWRPKSNNAG